LSIQPKENVEEYHECERFQERLVVVHNPISNLITHDVSKRAIDQNSGD
jgi:hypothetical protein